MIDAPVHECHHSDEASDGSALTCTALQQYPETFSECSGMRAGLYFAVCMQPPVCAGEAIYFQIAAG